MKKFLKIVWGILCVIVTICFLFASLSTFIPPTAFSYPALFGIGFPYILAVYLFCCIAGLFINRKYALIRICLLPISYFNFTNTFALRTEQTWQMQKDTSTLRIMTWNVQGFVNNLHKESLKEYKDSREGIIRYIHNYNPDIICIQEYRNIENAKRRYPVRKELDSIGYKYFYCSNDRVTPLLKNPKAILSEGVAIYSKVPLIDTGRVNINHDDKVENLIYADVMYNNKRVRIFTAHLQSLYIYTDTSGKFQDENIYEITYKKRQHAEYRIRETEIKHEQEVQIIRKVINQSKYPVIYCGDMNTTPGSYNYRLLKDDDLQDAFLAKGSGIGNTFYKIGPTLRIDFCLPDTAFNVIQSKREKIKLSDHYPVIADIKWK